MVTDALIEWLTTVVVFILGGVPQVDPPGWLLSTSSAVGTVYGYADSMGAWFPVNLTVTVVGSILAAWGIGFAVKVIRIVASFFTAGGGSAA